MADTNARLAPDAAGPNVVWMTPKQYLQLSPSMKDPDAGSQARELRDSLERGEAIATAPSLTISGGKVTAQDGRHRALALDRAGVRLIPVTIDGEIPKDGRLTGMMGGKVQLDAKTMTAPKPWTQVQNSEQFKRLPPELQQKARDQYFDQVVAPRVGTKDISAAREQFMGTVGGYTRIPPTWDMSTSEKFRAGIGKAFNDIGLGVRSMLPESVGGTAPGEVAERRQLDEPLMNTRAGAVGNFVGNVGLAAPAALVPGANTMVGAGLVGAGYGALQPAESMTERTGNALQGAALSAGVTGAARVVPSVYRALVDPFRASGQDRIAMDVLGKFAKDPNALATMNPRELVPGSRPTLAEATGDPGIAQLQRAAVAASPETASTFAQAATQRLQARKDALMKIAGDAYEKEFFQTAREATAQRLYGEAFAAPVDPKAAKAMAPQVKELLARPSIQRAQSEALALAKEEGEVLKSADLKGGSVKGMHYMKKALDSQISRAKAAGDDNLARTLKGTQDKLLGVIDQLSPDYKAARVTYAADSKPISRMEIGQYLYGKLVPALTDLGAERLTPAKFAAALKDGDLMAQRATGFKGAKLRDILSTEDMNTLVNLGLDLGREAKAGEAAMVKGSPTAQYLSGRNALRQVMGPLGLPEKWSESLMADALSNRWISLAASPVEKRVQARLAQFLIDPQAAAQAAAEQSQAANRLLPKLQNFAGQRVLPPVSVGNATYQVNRGNQ